LQEVAAELLGDESAEGLEGIAGGG